METYEVKVSYTRQTGEDNPGKVKEAYLVRAISCSDAEQQVINEIKPLIFGDEFEAPAVRKRLFFDIFRKDNTVAWYEVKVEMITIDGDRETRKAVVILQQANTLSEAVKEMKFHLGDYDCEIIAVKRSAIIDVLKGEEAAA